MSESSRYLKDLKRKALYSVSNMHLVPFSVMNAYDPVGARDNEVYISNADRKKYVVVSDGSPLWAATLSTFFRIVEREVKTRASLVSC